MSDPKRQPWVRYRDTGLYCVPSIHHRLVFAQLVVEACRRIPFDVIAVELPSSYRKTVRQALRLLPHPSLIINPIEGTELELNVPLTENPYDVATAPRVVKWGAVLPVSVCDSIVTALRCPDLLREVHPDWRPRILFIDKDFGSRQGSDIRINVRDDYEVIQLGLPKFLERLSESLEAAKDPVVDDRREQFMADQLRKPIDAGKKVLLVCGAGHWRGICRHLDEGPAHAPEATPSPDLADAFVAPIEPNMAWMGGWLDDIPRVSWEFESACRLHQSFDKLAALKGVSEALISRASAEKIYVSPRRLGKAKALADRLAAAEGCWIPKLGPHLINSAQTCVGEEFARITGELALEFPSKLSPRRKNAGIRVIDPNHWLVYHKNEITLVDLPGGQPERSEGIWVRKSHENPALTEDEERDFASRVSTTRDWPGDVQLAYEMDDAVRDMVSTNEKRQVSQRSLGGTGSGIDLRRTIRAKAQGDSSVYVRKSHGVRRVQKQESGHHLVTPVVWVFDSGVMDYSHAGTCAWINRNRLVHTSVTLVTKKEFLFEDEIYRQRMAALTDIGRSRSFLPRNCRPGVDDGRAEKKVDTRYLRAIPKDKVCYDSKEALVDLDGSDSFSAGDYAVACGIRYAADRIILVAEPSLQISPTVSQYARDQGVGIDRIPIQRFSRQRIDRFRWIYWVPCPGWDSYRLPYDWCHRFIPE